MRLAERHSELVRFVLATATLSLILPRLRPALVDGDGLYHASRAIYQGYLGGIDPKHPLAAMLLRVVAVPIGRLAPKSWMIPALSWVSHLSAIGVFLVLGLVIYPMYIRRRAGAFWAALGAVISYGVLSRAVTIEVYAPALFLAVAAVAWTLRADAQGPGFAAVSALLWGLAVGLHLANVLLAPFLLITIARRALAGRRSRPLIEFASIAALGALVATTLALVGRGASLWPPDVTQIIPRPDPQPTGTFAGRLARMAYGMSRSVAYLPDFVNLSRNHALAYGVGGIAIIGLLTQFAMASGQWRALNGTRQEWFALSVLVLPWLLVGLSYYPSDPERWMFLIPVLWLGIGRILDAPPAAELGVLAAMESRYALSILVLSLGAYNIGVGIVPETQRSRRLTGLQSLLALTTPADLVVSAYGIRGEVYEYVLGKKPSYRNLTLAALVARHPDAPALLQDDLRRELDQALGSGTRVFVFDLINEDYLNQSRHPWAHFPEHYSSDVFLTVLGAFPRRAVVPPTPATVGTYQLLARSPETP
jgi:hypothetical protein